MIDRTHALPVARSGQLLQLARSTAYYQPRPVSETALTLMHQLTITRPNPVWASESTYVPMKRGFVYLCAILDWATRRV